MTSITSSDALPKFMSMQTMTRRMGFSWRRSSRALPCQEILAFVQYFPNDLQRRMEQIIQQKVKEGLIRPKVGVQLLEQYSKAFHEYTYLDVRSTPNSTT